MGNKNRMSYIAALAFSTMFAAAASARSLLYYYDFDTVDANGNIVVSGVNKGMGNLEPSVVNTSGQVCDGNVGKREGGAFGDSSYAIWTSSNFSLWLPSPAADLGCGTTNGFTISMWVKPPANTATTLAWYDFFGFQIGSNRYRLEYSDLANEFRMYAAASATATSSSRPATVKFTPNVWSHIAIVATPNATNDNGTLTFYLNGNAVTNTVPIGKGVLNQIHIGQTVLSDNKDGAPIRSKGWSNTAIDEFALFDYPATAEQVKWLTKHKPGQPTGGPGREMPLCWRFERDNGGKAVTWNTGTGDIAVQSVNTGGVVEPYTMYGALNTISAFQTYGNLFTFAAMDDEAGLGATIGSGFSFSFWLYAGATPSEWADFFGFYLGSPNAIHLEWTNRENPRSFCAYGGSPNGEVKAGRIAQKWQHVALSYDAANGAVDIYLDGVKRASTVLITPFSQTDAVKRITAGPASYYFDNGNFGYRKTAHTSNTSVDELAFFNYSISPEEIAWLGSNIPKLPPLSATNLARTVSADCSWAGGLASWNVLDGTGADTGRRSIYPSCEDAEVEVAVSIAAADATITNDTFVTPAKLTFTNGTGGESAAVTLASGANTMFEPESLEVGGGVAVTVTPGEVSVAGELKFGQGAKIVFDMSGAGEEQVVKGLSFGSSSLPAGDSDLLSHFAIRNGAYEAVLSEDGKSVNLKAVHKFLIIFR